MIASPYLEGRDRYERAMEGWVDNTHADAFTHTVRITDDDVGVEVRAVCTPPPGYEVREAAARVLAGAADPAIARTFPALAGARMVGGFTQPVHNRVLFKPFCSRYTTNAHPFRQQRQGFQNIFLGRLTAIEQGSDPIIESFSASFTLKSLATLLGFAISNDISSFHLTIVRAFLVGTECPRHH